MKCGHTCKNSLIPHSIEICNDEHIREIWEGRTFFFLNNFFLQAPHTATYHRPQVGQGTRPTTTLVTDSIPFLYLFVIVMVSLLLELGGFVVSDDQCDEQKAIMSDHFSWKDGKFITFALFSSISSPQHFYCSICVSLSVSLSKTISQPERLSAMISRSINRSRYIADNPSPKQAFVVYTQERK